MTSALLLRNCNWQSDLAFFASHLKAKVRMETLNGLLENYRSDSPLLFVTRIVTSLVLDSPSHFVCKSIFIPRASRWKCAGEFWSVYFVCVSPEKNIRMTSKKLFPLNIAVESCRQFCIPTLLLPIQLLLSPPPPPLPTRIEH